MPNKWKRWPRSWGSPHRSEGASNLPQSRFELGDQHLSRGDGILGPPERFRHVSEEPIQTRGTVEQRKSLGASGGCDDASRISAEEARTREIEVVVKRFDEPNLFEEQPILIPGGGIPPQQRGEVEASLGFS